MKIRNRKIYLSLLTLAVPTAIFSASCSSNNVVAPPTLTLSNQKIDYLNKNSLSLNFQFIGNYSNLKKQIDQLVTDSTSSSTDTFDFSELANFTQSAFSTPDALLIINEMKMSQSGTGWVFDYSLDSVNNLVNYYIATNAHVTNTELKYTLYSSTDSENGYTIKIIFPVNRENVSQYNSYISQPYLNQQLPVFSSQYWFPTSTKNQDATLEPMPIGQLNINNEISIESTKEICFYYEITKTNDANTYYLYVTKDANNLYKVIPSWDSNLTSKWLNTSPLSDDFQIVKLSYALEAQDDPNISENNPRSSTIENNIRSLLTYNTDSTSINEMSSYIARLNYLIEMETNNITYDNKWFLFNELSNLDSDDVIYFGGFPIKTINNFTNTNVAVYQYAFANKRDVYDPYFHLSRRIIQYKYNGHCVINNYNNVNNFLVKNQQIGGGSSGSMVMANNQWIGIYWGVSYSSTDYYGVFTPIYSSNPNKQTIVSKYLEYIKKIDSNSKLLELFNLINMKK
ncbi:MAG: DUF31 family protein [Ureaplasma sp.]|nr:DUF31 family protein [Ureaplasma sp.]MDE7222036.1 DUF31 family protein [Ureaplasma sp.]